jgi:peptidoglycan lytic transglycosylase D
MKARLLIPMLLLAAGAVCAADGADAGSDDGVFARPTALEPAVAFWRRIYTEVTTGGGVIHDDEVLGVVYEVMDLPATLSPRARRHRIEDAKDRYAHILRTLADSPQAALDAEARRVRALWPEGTTSAQFRAAADRVRFQLGQADRFREGLIRSGAWIDFIRATFEREGLPTELAVLPHVESSFNTYAYSKVGAAGMWQFMPSTGRRFLRIDNVVDERLDPYASTRAAAQYLAQSYAVLGSWPLALTAYNHGTAGMRRARERMGTDDIAVIVRDYKSRSFGFASRNYYAAFLAALDIDRDPGKYFTGVNRAPVDSTRLVVLPDFVPAQALCAALDVDLERLRALNPSLLESVWNGSRRVPRGYGFRVPPHLDLSAALEQIPAGQRYAAQVPDTHHVVRSGDTLSSVAARYHVSMARLAALNGLGRPYVIRVGQRLVLPGGAASAAAAVPDVLTADVSVDHGAPHDAAVIVPVAMTVPPAAASADAAVRELPAARPSHHPPIASSTGHATTLAMVEPHSAPMPTPDINAGADEDEAPVVQDDLEPGLVPGAVTAATADPADYSVAADGTIVIQAAETLGHYAEWLDLRASRLRTVNRMSYGTPLVVGRRLKLDLSRVDAARFEMQRVAYHRDLQEQFFAAHRIIGSDAHVVRPGESVWILAARRYDLPLWLLRQYNPDVDFANLKPGVRLVIPQLETTEEDDAT